MYCLYKNSFKALIISVLCLTSSTVWSDEQTEYQAKLEIIREKITEVLNRLNKTESKRSNVKSELQDLEVKIAKTSKSLRYTRLKHKKSTIKLKELRHDLKQLKVKLHKQRNILSRQIRSAYAIGKQPQIKMVLNQQQPTEMGRAVVYYDYLNNARATEIRDYLSSIDKKQKLELNIEQTTKDLAILADKKLTQKNNLSKHREGRKVLLAKLNRDIDNQKLTLSDLKNSRSRIEQLLLSLGELLADIPNEPIVQKPFGKMQSELPWPVKGKFAAQFGTSRNQGDLTWNGVVINAEYGTPVRAISYGRVAFADWLQGFGFIVIVDHNDGYMSLYGHNQALFKQAGDWIEAGDVIATVGDSGGQEDSGLYFEIRYQGKPINPNKWCSSKIQHVALKDN